MASSHVPPSGRGRDRPETYTMQEKRITDDLEKKIECTVPPLDTPGIKNTKPCGIKYNGNPVYCSESKAINCQNYIVQLAKERQKYRGIEG